MTSYGFHKILSASIAAGPIFAASLALASYLSGAAAPVSIDISALAMLPGAFIVTATFGFFLAVVPNALGTAAMAWLGKRNIAMRLPVMWAIVGGTLAGLPFLFPDNTASDAGLVAYGFTATGACCALLCRRGVRWDED